MRFVGVRDEDEEEEVGLDIVGCVLVVGGCLCAVEDGLALWI